VTGLVCTYALKRYQESRYYLGRLALGHYKCRGTGAPCNGTEEQKKKWLVPIAGVASGSNNVIIGILAAVLYINNTGNGQRIDISMMDGSAVKCHDRRGCYSEWY